MPLAKVAGKDPTEEVLATPYILVQIPSNNQVSFATQNAKADIKALDQCAGDHSLNLMEEAGEKHSNAKVTRYKVDYFAMMNAELTMTE